MANSSTPSPSQFRGGANFTATQTGWLSMFDAQKTALAKSRCKLRRKFEAHIADLEAKKWKLREEMEAKITRLNNKFAPAGTYAPLAELEMNRKCWSECRLSDTGRDALISNDGLKEAHNVFNDIVRRRHILHFLRLDNNQKLLTTYVNKTIAGEPEGKNVKRLRDLLKIVGIEAAHGSIAGPGSKGKRHAPCDESGGTRHSRRKK